MRQIATEIDASEVGTYIGARRLTVPSLGRVTRAPMALSQPLVELSRIFLVRCKALALGFPTRQNHKSQFSLLHDAFFTGLKAFLVSFLTPQRVNRFF